MESQSDHLALECPYSDLSCITGTTTYAWEHLGRECPLPTICRIYPSLVIDAFLMDHKAQFFINMTAETSIVQTTNHPFLYISPDPAATKLP